MAEFDAEDERLTDNDSSVFQLARGFCREPFLSARLMLLTCDGKCSVFMFIYSFDFYLFFLFLFNYIC